MAKRVDEEKSLVEHLEELRQRLIISFLSVVLGAIFCYLYSQRILVFLLRPAEGLVDKLIYLTPTESFTIYIKIALGGGFIIALPIVLYEVWSFVAPGLMERERRYVLPLVFSSLSLFLIGASFCFYIVLPLGLRFLLTFGSDKLQPMITVDSYISFVTYLVLAFGLVFQLPLVMMFLAKIGMVNHTMLRRGRRYAILIIFMLAAVITPTPDIFNQTMLAIPLFALYEVSIWLARFVGRK